MTQATEKLDRPMPQSAEAEAAVLGAILVNSRAFYRVHPIVETADFSRDAHRTIYAAMKRMLVAGIDIEPLLLRDELARLGQLEKVGGVVYVSSLVEAVPDVANVERYATIVARNARLRRLIATGNEIMSRALEAEEAPEVISADAIAKLTPTATNEDAQARPLFEIVDEEFKAAERRATNVEKPRLLRTSFEKLASYEVLRPTLIVTGSPSNHGKSGWLMNVGTDIAQFEQPTAMFTLESTTAEIAWRWVSNHTGVPHSRVQDWQRLTDANDLPRVVKAHSRARELPFYMTRSLRTLDGIYAEMRRLKSVVGLRCVLIDYFQIIKHPGGPRDREERMAEMGQLLLEYAIDLELTIVVASQLNEDRKSRAGGRLHQSDLKYARAIGEAARVVLLFQRPAADDKANKDLRSCQVLFQVEKNNEGRTGDYEWHFDEVTQRFGEGGCEENRCRHFSKADTETSTLWG